MLSKLFTIMTLIALPLFSANAKLPTPSSIQGCMQEIEQTERQILEKLLKSTNLRESQDLRLSLYKADISRWKLQTFYRSYTQETSIEEILADFPICKEVLQF
jgi:hypothetical protein